MDVFNNVVLAPDDPILGLVEKFKQDPREDKINLTIGIYADENGKVPVLNVVKKAQQSLFSEEKPHVYLPMHGLQTYNISVQRLLFAEHHSVIAEDRLATVQTLGGTGALKVGADFLNDLFSKKLPKVYISDPTWDNHRAIFQGAGFEVESYPYFDSETGGVRFEAMVEFFKTLPENSIVVLHACCHNPTGADLNDDQWHKLADIIKAKSLIPFLDMAYQGFAKGVQEDAKAIHIMTDAGLPVLIANSFSKSFSLYGERVGALSVVTVSSEEQVRVTSQLKKMVRANYSSPPIFGAAIVGHVLSNDALRQEWFDELTEMRQRIHAMREKFTALLNEGQTKKDFSFIRHQQGMFSYSGLSKEQAQKLRNEHGIYILDTGRICIAALNEYNIVQSAQAIIKVL